MWTKRIKTKMLFKLSNLNSNLALTLGYLNPALNNSAREAEEGFRVNLPLLAGGVILLYVRPIFQPPPPQDYCTVSNFRFDFYAFFVSLLGTSLFFFLSSCF